ncbi:MAG TPA: iron-sulfur cluster assembly scaffold protein [Isosphaeraceae bacterium]|jgi:nitrogen fixation NifU-like protein
MDDDVLYREEILEHYHSSPHRGRLEAPDLAAELDNPLCGDRIRLELGLGPEGRIDRVRFDGHGCAISQAAASLLAEHVEGMTAVEARWVSSEEMLRWLGIRLSPTRVKCGLLAWRTMQRALPEAIKTTTATGAGEPR